MKNLFDIRYIWKTIYKISVVLYLLFLVCANLVLFAFSKAIHEVNGAFSKYEVCIEHNAFENEWFALMTTLLTSLTIVVFLILYMYGLKKRNNEHHDRNQFDQTS